MERFTVVFVLFLLMSAKKSLSNTFSEGQQRRFFRFFVDYHDFLEVFVVFPVNKYMFKVTIEIPEKGVKHV